MTLPKKASRPPPVFPGISACVIDSLAGKESNIISDLSLSLYGVSMCVGKSQVVNFTDLMQLVNTLQQACQFHQGCS